MAKTLAQAEAARRRLTPVQEWVLRALAENGETLTSDLGVSLANSPLGYYPGGGRRWQSPSECAQPHVSALVRKGYAIRPARSIADITPDGRDRVEQL